MAVRHIWASAGTHVRIHRRHVHRSPPKYSINRTIYNAPKTDYSWIWKVLAVIAGIVVVCCCWRAIVGILSFVLFFTALGAMGKVFLRH